VAGERQPEQSLLCYTPRLRQERAAVPLNLNAIWFAADNMKMIKAELKKHLVMPLTSNHHMVMSEPDKKDGRCQAVETLTLERGKVREVWLEQVAFPLLLVKQVFTNKDARQGLLYLMTSDTTLIKLKRLYPSILP